MFKEDDFNNSPDITESFGGVTYQGNPAITPDTVAALLSSNSQSPFGSELSIPNKGTEVSGGTSAGINRVNQDTGSTGVIAYKDAKGQAVFTNQPVRDAGTGAVINSSAPQVKNNQQPVTPDRPVNNVIAGMMNALEKAKSQSDATAAYEALTGAIAQGKTSIEANALEFAQNKLQIPMLERQLMEAEAADKADPMYYPGVGDSAITAGIRAQVNTARSAADVEAKRFLTTNFSYSSLDNLANIAKVRFSQIERQQINTEQRLLNDSIIRDRTAAERDIKNQDLAETISAETISRMQILNPGDFSKLDTGPEAALKAVRLLKGNRNKQYQEALGAEGDQLLGLSLQGNGYAKAIVASNEATATGRTLDQVVGDFKTLQSLVDSNDLVQKWAKINNVSKDKQGAMLAQLESLKDNKHEATARKTRMALDILAAQKTANYINDASSWNVLDPDFNLAIQKARQTTGNANLENTLTAYVGDASGQDRANKVVTFRNIAKDSSLRQKDSAFGIPNYRAAEVAINNWAAKGVLSKFKDKIANTQIPIQGIFSVFPGGAGLGQLYDDYQQLNAPTPENTDPTTGKKFGE
jgi:hypothetical protein